LQADWKNKYLSNDKPERDHIFILAAAQPTNFISLAVDRLNCTLKFNNQNKWRADGGRIKKRDSLCARGAALSFSLPDVHAAAAVSGFNGSF
jgi:hypothetical protein